MKPNIAFIGKMASGKSHASKFLRDKYGYSHLSLAAPIRMIEEEYEKTDEGKKNDFSDRLWRVLGAGKIIDNTQFWEFFKLMEEVGKIPRETPKPRHRLQFIGTEIGRKQIDPEIWIKIALHTVETSPESYFVCDDVRFLNEYEAFTKAGFQSLKLIVSPEIQRERLEVLYNMTFDEVKQALAHDSEQEIDFIPVLPEQYVNADQNLIKMFKEIEQKLELM